MSHLEGFQLPLSIIEDDFDGGIMFDHLPYSSFSRWAEEGSVYQEAFAHFPLSRLDQIRQLSLLSYAGADIANVYSVPTTHTRLDHSVTVGMISEEIMRQNKFDSQTVHTSVLAGLIHDIATPAMGDATKNVDPPNLSEEDTWQEVVGEKGLLFLQQKGISASQMDAIIHNEGVLGSVLDIADRITYVMKDAANLLGSKQNTYEIHPYLLPARFILSHFPHLGDVFKEVGISRKRQEVFFTNPHHLRAFLLLRANLTESYYMNPASQARDMFLARLLEPYYKQDGDAPFTPQKLRQMTDRSLIDTVAKLYEYNPFTFDSDLLNWFPKHQIVNSSEEASQLAHTLSEIDRYAVIGTKTNRGFNPATHYKVGDMFGDTCEFRERYPEEANQIENIAESTRKSYVFYVDHQEPHPMNQLLLRMQSLPRHT